MASEYIRIGTDSGGVVEINLREPKYKEPGKKSVVLTVPSGAEYKYDHPKDVSEFLKLSLAEIIQISDKMVTDNQETARQERCKTTPPEENVDFVTSICRNVSALEI